MPKEEIESAIMQTEKKSKSISRIICLRFFCFSLQNNNNNGIEIISDTEQKHREREFADTHKFYYLDRNRHAKKSICGLHF